MDEDRMEEYNMEDEGVGAMDEVENEGDDLYEFLLFKADEWELLEEGDIDGLDIDEENYVIGLINDGMHNLRQVEEESGANLLYFACLLNNSRIAMALLDKWQEDHTLFDPGQAPYDIYNGNTPLMQACFFGMHEVALRILATGRANPSHVNDDGRTALMLALWAIIRDNDVMDNMEHVAVEIIDTRNSNPGQVSNDGNTALMFACEAEVPEIALVMLELEPERSNPNYASQNGRYSVLSMARAHNLTSVLQALAIRGITENTLVRQNAPILMTPRVQLPRRDDPAPNYNPTLIGAHHPVEHEVPRPNPRPNPRQVDPYQIHRESGKIPMEPALAFFRRILPPPSVQFSANLFRNYQYINRTVRDLIGENATMRRQFDLICSKIQYVNFIQYGPSICELAFYCLEYAKTQSREFQENYMKEFLEQSVNAYPNARSEMEQLSCSKGILERFYMELRTACLGDSNPEHQQIAHLLEEVKSMDDRIMDWYKIHKVGTEGAFTDETEAQIRKSLKDFLMTFFPDKEREVEEAIVAIQQNVGLEKDDFTYGGKRRGKNRITRRRLRPQRNRNGKKSKKKVQKRKKTKKRPRKQKRRTKQRKRTNK